MPPKAFKCKQCGHCCLNLIDAFSTAATENDIRMWQDNGRNDADTHLAETEDHIKQCGCIDNGRNDILDWVDPIHVSDGKYVYDIWINPVTGEDVARCPWLRKLPNQAKYICRIHDVKPEHCRAYPRARKHAQETGCRGFED